MFRGVIRSKDIGSQEELHEEGLDRNLKTGIVKKMNKYVVFLNNAMANESSEAKSTINLEVNEVKDLIKKLSTMNRIKQMQKKQSSGLNGIEQVSSEDEETVISIY